MVGLSPNFRSWITALYSDTESIVWVNGFFTKPFKIDRSVRQGYPLSALLYVLVLEPLLQRLAEIWGTTDRLWCSRGTIAHANDVSIIVSDEAQLPCVASAIRKYEAVVGAKVKQDKSVGLLLST